MPLRLRAAARGGGYLLCALALQRQLRGEVGARGGAKLALACDPLLRWERSRVVGGMVVAMGRYHGGWW